MLEQGYKKALVILLGLTADRKKAEAVSGYFSETGSFQVFTPAIPNRRGLYDCAVWLQRYFSNTVIPERYEGLDVLAYISGGMVFRQMCLTMKPNNLNRIVYVRSPAQEKALRILLERFHPFFLWLLKGRLLLDIARHHDHDLPFPKSSGEQGLVIETGLSKLAVKLGLSAENILSDYQHNRYFLPQADDVVQVAESHDEVYSSIQLLNQISYFLHHGQFVERGNDLG